MVYKLNYKFQKHDHRDFKTYHHLVHQSEVPASYDLSKYMPPVIDQGELGSCVSNAVSNAVRYDISKHDATKSIQPSRLFIYYNGRVLENEPLDEDTGLTVRDGCKSVAKYSYCSENLWGYNIDKFAVKPIPDAYSAAQTHKQLLYMSVVQDEANIKSALVNGYPIVFGMNVYAQMMSNEAATTGMVTMPTATDQPEGGHCILLTGYDDSKKLWKCMNSWNTTWGDKGFFYLPYEYLLNCDLASDFWVLKIKS